MYFLQTKRFITTTVCIYKC